MLTFTKNEATALVDAFNGIEKADEIDYRSHILRNWGWYFTEEAKQLGYNLPAKHQFNKDAMFEKLRGMSEADAKSVYNRIHAFWGEDYHVEDTYARLVEVDLILLPF